MPQIIQIGAEVGCLGVGRVNGGLLDAKVSPAKCLKSWDIFQQTAEFF